VGCSGANHDDVFVNISRRHDFPIHALSVNALSFTSLYTATLKANGTLSDSHLELKVKTESLEMPLHSSGQCREHPDSERNSRGQRARPCLTAISKSLPGQAKSPETGSVVFLISLWLSRVGLHLLFPSLQLPRSSFKGFSFSSPSNMLGFIIPSNQFTML